MLIDPETNRDRNECWTFWTESNDRLDDLLDFQRTAKFKRLPPLIQAAISMFIAEVAVRRVEIEAMEES